LREVCKNLSLNDKEFDLIVDNFYRLNLCSPPALEEHFVRNLGKELEDSFRDVGHKVEQASRGSMYSYPVHIHNPEFSRYDPKPDTKDQFFFTDLGTAFVKACRFPEERQLNSEVS
jgi:hypothetical protein